MEYAAKDVNWIKLVHVTPYLRHHFESYDLFMALWASNYRLAFPMGQLKNILRPKAAHNNLGLPFGWASKTYLEDRVRTRFVAAYGHNLMKSLKSKTIYDHGAAKVHTIPEGRLGWPEHTGWHFFVDSYRRPIE